MEYKGPVYAGGEDDGTESQQVQLRTEASCDMALRAAYDSAFYANHNDLPADVLATVSGRLVLDRAAHRRFVRHAQAGLPPGYSSLEVSQPWLLYWSFVALDTLDATGSAARRRADEDAALRAHAAWTLGHLWDARRGGFAGAPGQIPHMVSTYAGVHAAAQIGTRAAYAVVDRAGLHRFLARMKRADGSFAAHDDGESDMRAVYGAVACAALANVLSADLRAGVAEWIARCQTYEGGIGGAPGNEAHGGYAFCALATLQILGRLDAIDVRAFARWLAARQMAREGGFQGRANKLVDACYSWWQGAVFAILGGQATVPGETAAVPGGPLRTPDGAWLLDSDLLQMYVLGCAQDERGGLRDKPTARRDLYHTCYALCGLSIAQQADLQLPITTSRNIVVCFSFDFSLCALVLFSHMFAFVCCCCDTETSQCSARHHPGQVCCCVGVLPFASPSGRVVLRHVSSMRSHSRPPSCALPPPLCVFCRVGALSFPCFFPRSF